MKTAPLLAIAALPFALSACASLPSATELSDGTVAVYVSTLREAPLPKPETQELADQKCGGTARYVATENVTPIKARHIYRCGGGGAAGGGFGGGYGSSSSGSSSASAGFDGGFGGSSGGASDGEVTSGSL